MCNSRTWSVGAGDVVLHDKVPGAGGVIGVQDGKVIFPDAVIDGCVFLGLGLVEDEVTGLAAILGLQTSWLAGERVLAKTWCFKRDAPAFRGYLPVSSVRKGSAGRSA